MAEQEKRIPRLIGTRQVLAIFGRTQKPLQKAIDEGRFPPAVVSEPRVRQWDYDEVMAWRAARDAERDARLVKDAEKALQRRARRA